MTTRCQMGGKKKSLFQQYVRMVCSSVHIWHPEYPLQNTSLKAMEFRKASKTHTHTHIHMQEDIEREALWWISETGLFKAENQVKYRLLVQHLILLAMSSPPLGVLGFSSLFHLKASGFFSNISWDRSGTWGSDTHMKDLD